MQLNKIVDNKNATWICKNPRCVFMLFQKYYYFRFSLKNSAMRSNK